MKEIVVFIGDETEDLYSGLIRLQKEARISYQLNIKENRLIINYDDGHERVEKFLLFDLDAKDEYEYDMEAYLSYYIILVGINKQADITLSSIEEESVFCLQRTIITRYTVYEPQELIVYNDFLKQETVTNKIIYFTVLLLLRGNDSDSIKELLNPKTVEYY